VTGTVALAFPTSFESDSPGRAIRVLDGEKPGPPAGHWHGWKAGGRDGGSARRRLHDGLSVWAAITDSDDDSDGGLPIITQMAQAQCCDKSFSH
jgi:hypothetical protein